MESITDELREWASSNLSYKTIFDELVAIADHIDASVADGYMKLPVGEDGEVWHIGDIVEWCDDTTAEVIAIGGNTLYYIDDGKDEADWTRADTNRHHHEPTVEDVLREFAEKMAENTAMYVAESWDAEERDEADAAAIAEYAKKLRLADDGTEHIRSK